MSQTIILNYANETELNIYNYPTGTHYFIIQASNVEGTTLSNCIHVNISNPGPPKFSSLFDGLYLNYTLNIYGYDYGTLRVDYTYLSGNQFLVNETSSLAGPIGSYIINNQTRFITNIGQMHFFYGNYPPYWIFKNQNLGDLLYIAIDGGGDHLFNITGESGINLPDLGYFSTWTLEDFEEPLTSAQYHKGTGILINSSFYYAGGAEYYTLTLLDTNLIFAPPGPPGPFTLSSDAGTPDSDGTFTLDWSLSENATHYNVYYDDEFISEINGSQTLIANMITDTDYYIFNYPNGTYYFIIEAYNLAGTILSNCIEVNISKTTLPKFSPIADRFYLNFTFGSGGMSYLTIRIDYTYISGNIFLVNETVSSMGPYGAYHINNLTREITEIGMTHIFSGNYPPYWIFSNQQLGNTLYIGVNGEGDHLFNITGDTSVALPGVGSFMAWTLEDSSEPQTLALYDKATGILLDSVFFYAGGSVNYTLTLNDFGFVTGDPPGGFILGTNADSPDPDGDFNLIWTVSSNCDSYSVYQSSSFITVIDGSVTLLESDITTLLYSINNYDPGTYYFIVVATNDYGETLSNCIEIVVGTEGPPDFIPGYEPFIILGILGISILLVIERRKKKT
jgi:hypothetical protein